jgi:hypothetical protein
MDETPDDRRARLIRWGVRCQKLGLQMAALGVIGGLVGAISRESAGLTEVQQKASGLVVFLYWLFGVIFLTGLLVVLPSSSIFYRRAGIVVSLDAKPNEAHGNLAEASAEVAQREILPRWIGWPIWAVVTVASLILIYGLLFYALPSWVARS